MEEKKGARLMLVTVPRCRTVDEFIDCLKEASSASCSQEAGNWIHTAKQIYFGPTKKQLRCSDMGIVM